MKIGKKEEEITGTADYWFDYQITIHVEPIDNLPALPVIQF